MRKKIIRDSNSNAWGAPFGGFFIGDPITNPRESLEDYLAPELEDPKTAALVKKYIDLEVSGLNYSGAESPSPATTSNQIIFAHEDTTVGGCQVMNPLYQFGEDDDIVPPINYIDSAGNGMGRVYSEMYRDNQHILWLAFGVPRFNRLSTFYRQAYNKNMIDVMTSGDTSLSAKIGTIIGTGVGLALSLPILVATGIARAYDAATGAIWGNNIHKYYELKPAMHNYYKVVNTILASLCVHMNIIPQGKPDETSPESSLELQERLKTQFPQFSDAELGEIATMDPSVGAYPHVLDAGPDIIKIMSIRHKRRRKIRASLLDDNGDFIPQDDVAEDSIEMEDRLHAAAAVVKHASGVAADAVSAGYDAVTGEFTMPESLKQAASDIQATAASAISEISDLYAVFSANFNNLVDKASTAADESGLTAASSAALKTAQGAAVAAGEKIRNAYERIVESESVDMAMATVTGDNAFIGFRIEKGSDVSESISNSMGESSLGQKLKSMSQGARTRHFDFAGGNLGLGPIDGIVAAIGSTGSMLAGSMGLGGLADMAIKGSGYIDVPKVWQDSNFSKSTSFNVKLQSTYADELSIYQSIYIPLALLMAASFPMGIGKNSYSSPFLVQAYSKGMFSIPLGMISSLSIRRGASENGWTHGHLPTVIDISLTIEDLSPMMYLSMTDKNLLEVFAANTSMQDYFSTLAGISLQERSNARKQMIKKWKITKQIWAKNTFNMGMLMHKIGSGTALRRAYQLRGRNIRTGT